MQLLIILALLLYGGKLGAQNVLNEVKPVLESFGGEEIKQALKSAEEISSYISAMQAFTGAAETNSQQSQNHKTSAIAFPLEPVNEIAPHDITYSLSKYINEA